MCAQRIHRVFLAVFIVASIGVLHGYDFFIGTYMFVGLAVLMLVWAIFDFCPILFVLNKAFNNCKLKKYS